MARINKVYLTLGGGLGDVFWTYFNGHNGWNLLEPFRKRYQKIKVKVMCSTHNPQTQELLKYNPYIDEVLEFGWTMNGAPLWKQHAKGAMKLSHGTKLTRGLKPKNPRLYLSPEDEEVVNGIHKAGKFVFIHPFAGLKDREALPIDEYIPLIDTLIDERDLNVVIVGGTHDRKNLKKSFLMKEEFTYERDRLFNLVNKTNARVASRLCMLADSFIGTWSAFSCMSWIRKKRTTVIIKQKARENLQKKFKSGARWHRRGDCKLILVRPGPCYKTIRQRVMRRYK